MGEVIFCVADGNQQALNEREEIMTARAHVERHFRANEMVHDIVPGCRISWCCFFACQVDWIGGMMDRRDQGNLVKEA